MYTLYTIPGSCSTGIVILLEKLQLAYTPIPRQDVPDYADIVPTNQVPALRLADGQIITEGAAIVLYLLEKHKSPMLPTDLAEKAEFLRWLMFNYATLHPAYGKLFALRYRVKIDEEARASALEQLAASLTSLWDILDRELEKKPFITGDKPNIVDYLVAIYSSWNSNFPSLSIPLGDNVLRLINQVADLPEFKAGYSKENISFSKPA